VFAITTLIFLKVEKKAADPIIPISFFKDRFFTGFTVLGFVAGILNAQAVILVIYMGEVLKIPEAQTGFYLLPLLIAVMIGSVLAGS